jgi:hypothetical protein
LAVMFSVYLLLAPKCMSGICPLHAAKRWAIKRSGHHHNWCSSLNSMARTSSRRQLEVSTIQIYYVKYFDISLGRANRFHEPPMVKGEEVRTGICDSDMPPFLASITTAKITCASARRKTRIPLACFTIPKIAHAHYDSPLSLSLCYFLKPLLSLSL